MTSRGSLVERGFPNLKKPHQRELEYADTEYLYDIYGATAYTMTSILAQPGMMESFPKLSSQAQAFEMYRFEELEFYYKPFVVEGVASNDPALGFIGAAFTYDASEVTQNFRGTAYDVFPSKVSLLNYQGAISVKPNQAFKFTVDCNKRGSEEYYYIRRGGINNIDLRMTDLGSFCWAVGGQQSAYLLGELYVRYKVRFQKARLSYALGNSNKFAHYQLSGVTTSTMFGTSQVVQPGTDMPLTFSSVVNSFGDNISTMYFPSYPALCQYVVVIAYFGDNGSWAFNLNYSHAPAPTLVNLLASGFSGNTNLTGTGAIQSVTLLCFNTPNNFSKAGSQNEQASLLLGSAGQTLVANITNADLFVMQIPGTAA